jgi:hypothetical protein
METRRYVLYEGNMIVVVKMSKRCYLFCENVELVGGISFSYFGLDGRL